MDKRNYTCRIKEAESDQFPLLPGLAELLKQKCCAEEPEAKYKHVQCDENGCWSIDEDIACYLWYPGSPLQSSFYEVVKHRPYLGELRSIREYYQIEYYRIPNVLANFNAESIEDGHAWIVTSVNNVQLEEWYRANGTMDFSEEVINQARSRKDGKTIRNECNGSMEQGKKRADD